MNRAYFGTDSRAQALLIGCAVAAALPSIRARLTPMRSTAPAPVSIVLAALAGPAVLAVGWLWVRADGSAAWLYRGGLTAGGVAVAVVLAHVVLQPRSPIARMLAVPPLVWLGRISYGVYLWHWPLFTLVNNERTGLTGPSLLAARLAVTLAVSVVSYVGIEQPIRTGTWPGRLRLRTGRFGPGVAAVGAVAATAAVIVLATVLPARVTVTSIIAIPTAPSTFAAAVKESRSPMRRVGRAPGTAPRISFFGDSVAFTLGYYMQEFPRLDINTQAMPGCGVSRLPDIIYVGEQHTNYEDCHIWDQVWQARVDDVDPDVAVILLDRWELMDRKLGDRYLHVGQPLFDAYPHPGAEARTVHCGCSGGARRAAHRPVHAPLGAPRRRPVPGGPAGAGGRLEPDCPVRGGRAPQRRHRHRPQPPGLPRRQVHLRTSGACRSAATACTSPPRASRSGSPPGSSPS